jgi:hypothetical protein
MEKSFMLNFLRKNLVINVLLIFLINNIEAQISGVVFRDFNGDGVLQTASASYEEPSISGITVSAYNAANTLVGTTTTSSTGTYAFSGLTLPVRIEFTGLPTGFYTSKVGSSNASSVQFYSAATTSANFAVNLPSEYSQPSSDKIAGVQMDNATTGTLNAIYTVPYGNTGNSSTGRANLSSPINPSSGLKVGAVWGLAYQPTTDRVFTSAFMRRFAGFGTGGTGAIYVTTNAKNNPASSATSLFINLNGMTVTNAAGGTTTISTGSDPHYYTNLQEDIDNSNGSPFDAVGKISFGDMDISDDKKYLYVVSLNDKKLYRIEIDSDNNINTNPTAADVLAYNLPTGSCSSGTARPFGLGIRNNEIYVGVICDAASTAFSPPPTSAQTATVYRLSGTTFSSIISFPMNYYRGLVSTGDFSAANDHRFRPWISTWTCIRPYSTTNSGRINYPQPMLSDIVFDVDGSMILGIGDRFAYQVANGIPNTNYSVCIELFLFDGRGGGDILRVCNTGTLNNPNYVLEGNAGCSRTTSSEVTSYPNSLPAEEEFYVGDNYDEGASPAHTETTQGALVMSYGSKRVVTTAFNPIDTDNGGGVFRNGFKYLSNTNGADLNGYDINGTFGKCSGVGDLELLGNLAPIEIGNRVFMDTDEDGIQDAGEMGIANVTVKLFNAGVEVSSTTTDANGQYLFANVSPNTAYEIRILASNIPSGKQLTLSNTGGGAAGSPEDMRDNDAILISSNAVISYTTGNAGQNDHTLDFGFKTVACAFTTSINGTTTTCVGGTLTATATGGTTYLWSGPGGFTATTASISRANATTAMNGLYFVTVTNSLGCTATASASLAAITLPAVPVLTNSGPICSGQPINLTVSGLAPSGQAISLNGTNQYVNVVQDLPEYNFTIETWVKTAATNGGIFGVRQGGVGSTAHDRHIAFMNGNLYVRVWNGVGWYTGVTINDNQWHHIALVVETDIGQRVYVDGIPVVTTNNYDHSDFAGQNQFSIGYSEDIGYLNGQIDNTRIWNVARTPQQIMDNMRLNTPASTTGLIANYLFNGNVDASTGVNGTTPNGVSYVAPAEYIYNWTGTNAPTSGSSETVTTMGAASGSYSVSYTKGSCVSGTASTTPTINIFSGSISGTSSICTGQSTTLTASGGTSYVWSNTATTAAITVSPTVTTTYTVTITNAVGCIATSSITVTVNALIIASATGDTECAGATINLSSTANGYIELTPDGNMQNDWGGFSTDIPTTNTWTFFTTNYSSFDHTTNNGTGKMIFISDDNTPITNRRQIYVTKPVTAGRIYTLSVWIRNTTVNTFNLFWTVNNTQVGSTLSPISSAWSQLTTTWTATSTGTATFAVVLAQNNANYDYVLDDFSIQESYNGGYTYSWSGPSSFTSTLQNPTRANATTAMAGTYTVTVTNAGGCTSTATANVVVNTLPTPNISGTNTICSGASTTLTASGGTSYLWNTGATTAAITVSPTVTTTYSVTVTNVSGCSATANSTVTVNTSPTVMSLGLSVCFGGTINLSSSGGSSYVWSGPNSFSSVLQSPSIASATNLNAGTYTVTVTNTGGCTAIGTISVVVRALPSTSIDGITTICNGQSTTLTATGGGTYLWSTGSVNASIFVSPTVTTAYWLTVTSTVGCTASSSITVTVNNNPTVNIIGNGIVCSGQSTTLTASGGTSYVWSNAATTAAITVSPTVTTTYSVTATNASSCTATSTLTVTLNSISPTVSITSTLTTCNNYTLTANRGLGNAVEFTNSANKVDCGNATSVQITGTKLTLEALIYPKSWRTNYWEGSIINKESFDTKGYMLRVGNNGTISFALGTGTIWEDLMTSTSTLSLNTWYHIAATYDGTTMKIYLNGNLVASKFSSVIFANAGPNLTIGNWGPGTDRGFPGIIDEARVWNIARTQAQIAADMYRSIAPNSSGLRAYYKLDEGTGTTTVDATGLGNTGTLTNAPTWVTPTGTPLNPVTYLWSTGATTSSITATQSGTYTVTVTNSYGCTASANIPITIVTTPPTITGITAICSGKSTTLSTSGGGTYFWNTGSTAAAITVSPTVTTTYAVTITNVSGCTSTASITVTVNTAPVASIIGLVALCSSTSLFASGGGTYLWSNGATISSISVNPTVTTTYYVTVTNVSGCTSVDNIIASPNWIPTVTITGTPTICNGQSTTLTASGGGTYTWNTTATNPSISVSPTVTTTYSVTVINSVGCIATANQSVTVTTPPNAGTASPLSICKTEISATTDLFAQLTGEQTGGTWQSIAPYPFGMTSTLVDAKVTSGILQRKGFPAGAYTFRYTVIGTSPCPNDTEDVIITINSCCPPAVCLPTSSSRL